MSPPARRDRSGARGHRRQTARRGSTRRATALAAVCLVALGVVILAATRPGTARHAAVSNASAAAPPAGGAPPPVGGTLPTCGVGCDPIDRRYLDDLPFGAGSFWIQPWRAYLDTWPASRLVDALGINFNVRPPEAQEVARLLHDAGFRLARIGISWDSLSYADPTRFVDEADLRTRLLALRDNGLRPLILLDANSEAPCPGRRVPLDTVAPAPAGASTVTLSAASAAAVVPGKTGFDAVTLRPASARRRSNRKAQAHTPLTPAQRLARRAATRAGLTPLVLHGNPAILITSVSPAGVATLSRPLPVALAAGPHTGTTLLYAPFAVPTLSDGSPNPVYRATLKGWLGYVSAVAKLAQSVFGRGGYDLEVWNELSFGSQFLDVANYHADSAEAAGSPTTPKQRGADTKAITKALLDATVAYVRNPADGISSAVGVSNGFASETPFPSPAFAPAGLTAYSKHPYEGAKSFPAEYRVGPGNVPRDALGRRDTAGPPRSAGRFTPLFVPRYQSLFPEYTLTATSTETLIRDLAPFTTYIYKAPHGRHVSRPGQVPPQVWVTEYNLGSAGVTPTGPDGVTPQTGPSAQLTPADKEHFEAKVLLRSLVAMVGEGVTREYFYAAANAGDLSLIGQSFMAAAAAHPTTYPGDQLGGEVMSGFHNLLARFRGPGLGPRGTRQLALLAIAQDGDHAQFTGDGTVAHPDLYDRDVLAVFPFQSSPTRFVIPVYVMTRDELTLYEPHQPSTDVHRFDLPNETFRITLGNLPATRTPPTVSAYDPLRNATTPARLLARTGTTATFAIAATDYPRVLTIAYASPSS